MVQVLEPNLATAEFHSTPQMRQEALGLGDNPHTAFGEWIRKMGESDIEGGGKRCRRNNREEKNGTG